MEKSWNGLPYFPISQFYIRKFGGKVYKIPVSVVDNCPNRMGLKGMETCVFCDVWGSAAKSESMTLELRTQIEKYQASIAKKFKVSQFLVYFQAYTNTFTKISALENNFAIATSYPFVKGLVIGTRPDCISPAVMRLWQTYHEKSFVAVELGVQSFFDDQLQFLKRGHTAEDSLKAITRIRQDTSVDLGIHLMFGLPNETIDTIRQTARIINDLPISNVKLHNLHVLKNTGLEGIYERGEFQPIEREEYSERVRVFIQELRPDIAIHRLAALSSRWDELIAPKWTQDKMGTHQFIVDHLRKNKSYQSELYQPRNETESSLQLDLQKQACHVSFS